MFQCDKCGACCRSLNNSSLYDDLNRGDGVCKYLEGNLCSIYPIRPLKCRVDEGYDIYFAHKMSKEEYYRENYRACKILKQNNKQ